MHRLALALGCFVSDIDERMPSSELTDWLAYYKLEPFGAERDNWHAAQIAAILVNQNRAKGAPVVPMTEFMYVDRDTTAATKTQNLLSALKRKAKRKD